MQALLQFFFFTSITQTNGLNV